MKPIAIFRHSPGEGAGYFATFLDHHSLPWELIRIDAGVPPPRTSSAYSGLCFMGGPMSVNDDFPWIAAALDLIRDADCTGVPVIGHCLGGQLMSKAFGGMVCRNPVKEIGWGTTTAVPHPLTTEWLGNCEDFLAFQWHGETFSIPDRATRLLKSTYCDNQIFVLGNHLGMQCHVEMTADMIRHWCDIGAAEIASAHHQPSVQDADAMQQGMDEKIAGLRLVADRLYGRWIRGLKTS